MAISLLDNYNDIDKAAWANFVRTHPEGNIFQTPEMYDIYKLTPNYEPLVFVALNNGVIVGVLLALVQKYYSGMLGRLTARSLVIGGPLVSGNNNLQIAQILMESYDSRIRTKAVYSQFRNIFDISYMNSIFSKLSYQYEEHLDIYVDLEKEENQLWMDVHARRRHEIRKAEKANIQVKQVATTEDRNTIYQILKEVYGRAKLPLASNIFFENAYHILAPKEMIKFYGAFYQNKLVGTMITLCYKDLMYDWYAGGFKAYYKKGPNNIIPWRVFQHAKALGFRRFDFGGAGSPSKPYGVRDYKQKFGGEFVNYGRYEKIHKKWTYKFISCIFVVRQKLGKLGAF